jgi:LmbE family N-acetylglucosaminyl deacetylase
MGKEELNTQLWFPDKDNFDKLSENTTHMAIGAHCDDLEIIGLDGIVRHFENKKNNFYGVVVSNSQGKPYHPKYRNLSPEQIQKIREREQIKAAGIGQYTGLAFLNYPSNRIKNKKYKDEITNKIQEIIKIINPKTLYTHNPFDRHPTHVVTCLRVIEALRGLKKSKRPSRVYGVEVWGSLDWLPDDKKVAFDVSAHKQLTEKLLSVYKSQNYKNNRYDEAVLGRMRANSVFSKPHQFSKEKFLIYALDLLPLLKGKTNIGKYLKRYLETFLEDSLSRIDDVK